MPVDPTHPKIVEGDDVLARRGVRQSEDLEDDVTAHVFAEPESAPQPDGQRDPRQSEH